MRRHLASGLVLVVCAGTAAVAAQRLSFFKPVETVLTDEPIAGAATGDFNGDGLSDLAVSTPRDGTVYVALGERKGSFETPVPYAGLPGSGDLAVADLNHDGALDIVVDVTGIGVLLGRGDGTFDDLVITPGRAKFVVIADFDGDGTPDLLSVGKNLPSPIPETVDIYRGFGDGTFDLPRTIISSDNNPGALSAGDFNNDGRTDFALNFPFVRSLQVYVNDGGLEFSRAGSSFTDPGALLAIAGDLDGDGLTDVVTSNPGTDVSVFLSEGDGTLQPRRTFTAGATAQSLALADVNADGLLDVIAASGQPGGVSILLNAGGGDLEAPLLLDVADYGSAAVAGDFDGDLTIDVAAIGSNHSAAEAGRRAVFAFINKLNQKKPR